MFEPSKIQVLKINKEDLLKPALATEVVRTLLLSFACAVGVATQKTGASQEEVKAAVKGLMSTADTHIAELPGSDKEFPEMARTSAKFLGQFDHLVQSLGLLTLKGTKQSPLKDTLDAASDEQGKEILGKLIQMYDSMSYQFFADMLIEAGDQDRLPIQVVLAKHKMEFDPEVQGSVGWAICEGIPIDDRFKYTTSTDGVLDPEVIKEILAEVVTHMGKDADPDAIMAAAEPRIREYIEKRIEEVGGTDSSIEMSASSSLARSMVDTMAKKQREGATVVSMNSTTRH